MAPSTQSEMLLPLNRTKPLTECPNSLTGKCTVLSLLALPLHVRTGRCLARNALEEVLILLSWQCRLVTNGYRCKWDSVGRASMGAFELGGMCVPRCHVDCFKHGRRRRDGKGKEENGTE
jgi:hypothetical protein